MLSNLKEYLRPNTLEEAHEWLTRKEPRTVLLNGGTWLIGEAQTDVEAVVDLAQLGLNKIDVDKNGIRVGASVTLQQLVEHARIGKDSDDALHVIGETAQAMAGMNIRNQATIGGAVVTADFSSPLATALLACDAEVVTYGVKPIGSKRAGDIFQTMPLSGFFSYGKVLLNQGAIITEIRLPVQADAKSKYVRVARTPKDYPIVCVVAHLTYSIDTPSNVRAQIADAPSKVRIAVGGVASTPIRLTELELGLEKRKVADVLESELNAALVSLQAKGDWLGSADYRKDMTRILVKRAVMEVS
jgi:CO/xanthine dehydrogenase FAD-binding subunit